MTTTIDNTRRTTIGRRTAWLVVGQSVIRSGQILTAVLLVKFLAPTEWNSVALALTIYLAAITVGSFNLEHSILFYLPTLTKDQAERLFGRTAIALTGMGLFLGSVIVLVAHFGWGFASTSEGALVAVAVALELPTVIAGPTFISRGRERLAGIWDSTLGIVQLMLLVIPCVLSFGHIGVLCGLAVASFIRFGAFIVIFGRDITGRWHHADKHLFIRQLMFCAPLGLALATGVLTRTIDKWYVAWKIPTSVGIYAIAAQEVPVLAVLPYASGAVIAVAMVKHFAAGDYAASFSVWIQQVRAMCRPVIALTMLVVLIAPEIFDIALAPTYQHSVLPFQIFSIIGLHRVTEYGAVLRAVGRTKEIVMSSVVLFGLNACFAAVGLYFGGVVGLTVGSVFAFLGAWIWMLTKLGDVFTLKVRHVFPWGTWIKWIGFFGSAALLAEATSTFIHNSFASILLKCVLMAIAYFVSVSGMGSREQKMLPEIGLSHVI